MDRRRFTAASLAALTAGFIPMKSNASGAQVPTGYIRTNWSRDPYALGSYSYFAKGAKQRDTKRLAEPIENRIFFAGEATHPDYNSTVHAAFESGELAAEAIAETDHQRIGILGAGVAGIAAAEMLDASGLDVTVLEARSRTGGRIWTDDQLGAPVDLGASWIHGTDDNPIARRADDLDVQTVSTTAGTYIIRGGDGRQMSDAEAPAWLDEVAEIQQSLGADASDVNLRAYWHDRDYGGDEVVFPRGYAQLFDGLGDVAEVRLNWEAVSIKYNEQGVTVTNRQGDTFECDALMVTVPLGVLKANKIRFDPALPRRKTVAIDALGMGLLDKLYLRFDEIFWDNDRTWILTPENGLPPGQFNQWLNMAPITGVPILMAFNGAGPARALASESDETLVNKAMQTLSRAYP